MFRGLIRLSVGILMAATSVSLLTIGGSCGEEYAPTEGNALSAQIDGAKQALARREMEVARTNMRRGNYIGAITRLKVVVTQYQTSSDVAEALLRLAYCYLVIDDPQWALVDAHLEVVEPRKAPEGARGIVYEAQAAAAALGDHFPDSLWNREARDLLRLRGLEPQADEGSWITKALK
jgi:outer membrane protein assembly factor BamD